MTDRIKVIKSGEGYKGTAYDSDGHPLYISSEYGDPESASEDANGWIFLHRPVRYSIKTVVDQGNEAYQTGLAAGVAQERERVRAEVNGLYADMQTGNQPFRRLNSRVQDTLTGF